MSNNIFKTKGFWLSVAVCLLPALLSLAFYDKMPDTVVTHWNFKNEPDGYSPKWVAVFLIPSVLFAANILIWFALNAKPKKRGINRHIKGVVLWTLPVLSVIVQCMIIMFSVKGINLVRFVPLIIGIMFVVIGNYLPKCRQNFTMGIKLPWTLASEENWNRTHRLAGKLWIIGGFIMSLYAIFEMHTVFFIIVIIMMIIIPSIYSYAMYRKGI